MHQHNRKTNQQWTTQSSHFGVEVHTIAMSICEC